MAVTVTMPIMGSTIRVAYIIRWYKQEGECVFRGDPLVEIFTKKALFKVEAPVTGSVYKLLVPEKTPLPFEIPLAVLAEEGDTISLLEEMVAAAQEALRKAPQINTDLETVLSCPITVNP